MDTSYTHIDDTLTHIQMTPHFPDLAHNKLKRGGV